MSDSIFFENDFMRLEKKEGILFGTYKKGPLTIDMAKQAVKLRLKFTDNNPVLMVASENGLKGIERAARQFLSSEEGMKGVKAGAIVTKSAFASHLANIYMKLSLTKPKIPIKMFSNEEEAISWLKKIDSK